MKCLMIYFLLHPSPRVSPSVVHGGDRSLSISYVTSGGLNPQIAGPFRPSQRATNWLRAYSRVGVENRRVGVGSTQAPVTLPN